MTQMAAMFVVERLVHLAAVDVVIIAFYFALVLAIGWYLREQSNTGEDFFMAGREMTAWIAGRGLSVRHPRDSLVLDWRDSRDALPGAGNDAVLLHLQDALGTGLPKVAF